MEQDNEKDFAEILRNQGNRISQFQEKFVYYILAIDAACIGFILNYTKDNLVSYWLIPVVIAVLCWGISFYFGIREIQLTENLHKIQYNFIEGQLHDSPEMRSQKFHEMVENDKKLKPFNKYKLTFMYCGVGAFLLWYVLNLVLHTTACK